MAHHCREHWASQHIWQTMPVKAVGQRSAGSGIWAPQSEQVGMMESGIGKFLAKDSELMPNHQNLLSHAPPLVVVKFRIFCNLYCAFTYFPAVLLASDWIGVTKAPMRLSVFAELLKLDIFHGF